MSCQIPFVNVEYAKSKNCKKPPHGFQSATMQNRKASLRLPFRASEHRSTRCPDWAELPQASLLVVFQQVARHDLCSLLCAMLRVCRPWREVWQATREFKEGSVWQAVRTLGAASLWPAAPLDAAGSPTLATRAAGKCLARILGRCVRLTSLSLRGCQGVHPRVLQAAGPSLRALDARVRPSGANDVWLREIGKCCPGLTSLHIGRACAPPGGIPPGGATRSALAGVASRCPHVQHLEVRHLGPLISWSVLCELGPVLARLTSLDIVIRRAPDEVPGVRPLERLAIAFPHLKVLDVRGTDPSVLDEQQYDLTDRFPHVVIRTGPTSEDLARAAADATGRAQ